MNGFAGAMQAPMPPMGPMPEPPMDFGVGEDEFGPSAFQSLDPEFVQQLVQRVFAELKAAQDEDVAELRAQSDELAKNVLEQMGMGAANPYQGAALTGEPQLPPPMPGAGDMGMLTGQGY